MNNEKGIPYRGGASSRRTAIGLAVPAAAAGLMLAGATQAYGDDQESDDPHDAAHITYQPPGHGSVSRTVRSRLADVVSVADFDTAADGVTDDHRAIQAALDAARPGQVLVFPPGDYLVNAKVFLNEGQVVSGYGATIRRGPGALDTVLSNNRTRRYTKYDGPGNFVIEGLTVDGAADAGSKQNDTAAFVHAKNITIRDCSFLRTKGAHSLEINSCMNVTVENCQFRGYFTGGSNIDWMQKEALQIDVGDDRTMCRNIRVIGCYAGPDEMGNPPPNVLVGSHSPAGGLWHEGIVVQGCVGEGLAYALVTATTWRSATITGNVLRGARAYGILVNQVSDLVTVIGNTLEGDSSTEGIKFGIGGLGAPTNCIVVGNTIRGGCSGTKPAGNLRESNLFTLAT